jgi:hypothetical protein
MDPYRVLLPKRANSDLFIVSNAYANIQPSTPFVLPVFFGNESRELLRRNAQVARSLSLSQTNSSFTLS